MTPSISTTSKWISLPQAIAHYALHVETLLNVNCSVIMGKGIGGMLFIDMESVEGSINVLSKKSMPEELSRWTAKNEDAKSMYSLHSAAAYACVGPTTLRRALLNKEMPYSRTSNGPRSPYQIDKLHLDQWIAYRKRDDQDRYQKIKSIGSPVIITKNRR